MALFTSMVGPGWARRGWARRGMARQGFAILQVRVRLGAVRLAKLWRGKSRCGVERQGRDFTNS
jgi:hypothetical protein